VAKQLALVVAVLALTHPARAEEPPGEELPPALRPVDGPYLHMMGSLALGRGIRFNNPYRLATPLGDDAESLSLSATYLDLGVSAASGDPDGLQHGGSLHFSVALQGIPQEVLTPSYLLAHRLPPRFIAFARAGLPFVLEPDPNLGYELAVGAGYLVTAGLGVTAELVGDLFYGAATQDEALTAIPMLSLQLGAFIDFEVLP
jgi:hypothetical protein